MSKPMIWAVVGGIVIIGGIGAFVSRNNNSNNDSMMADTSMMEEAELQSIIDLISAGKAVECDFEDVTGTTGTIYAAGGKVRGDFVAPFGQQQIQAHTIVDGEYVYSWAEGFPGVKFKLEGGQEAPDQETVDQASLDLSKKLEYDCDSWRVDQSVFVVPSSVQFNDLSAMMQGAPVAMPVDGQIELPDGIDCSICDSAPAEAQAQCRASLGC